MTSILCRRDLGTLSSAQRWNEFPFLDRDRSHGECLVRGDTGGLESRISPRTQRPGKPFWQAFSQGILKCLMRSAAVVDSAMKSHSIRNHCPRATLS